MPRSRYQLCGFSIRRSQRPVVDRERAPGRARRRGTSACRSRRGRRPSRRAAPGCRRARSRSRPAAARRPCPRPAASRSDSTPVEVSAWTAAITFGRRVGGQHALGVDRLPPLVLDRARPRRRSGAATSTIRCAEQAVDADDDDVARSDGVDERRLHAGRAGGRQRQGEPVRRAEHLAQPVGGLVEDARGTPGRGGPAAAPRARRSPPGTGWTVRVRAGCGRAAACPAR